MIAPQPVLFPADPRPDGPGPVSAYPTLIPDLTRNEIHQ
jgi:hypothetical protein